MVDSGRDNVGVLVGRSGRRVFCGEGSDWPGGLGRQSSSRGGEMSDHFVYVVWWYVERVSCIFTFCMRLKFSPYKSPLGGLNEAMGLGWRERRDLIMCGLWGARGEARIRINYSRSVVIIIPFFLSLISPQAPLFDTSRCLVTCFSRVSIYLTKV